MESFYLDRPLSFAHRGASHEAPANTLAAFLMALEMHADGVELDVHLSRDGEVVVIHDFTLEATTNGSGFVADKTLEELRALDAGGWFDPVYAGQQIPTLQEVIDVVGHRLLLNIELKTQSTRDNGLAAAVVRLVEKNHMVERVVVSSFDPLALRRVHRLNTRIAIGLLYGPERPAPLIHLLARWLVPAGALHPHHSLVDSDYVYWAKKQGYRIHTWTADDPGNMWQLMRLAVDIIITNRPDLLRQVLIAGQSRWWAPSRRMLPSRAAAGG